jgi:hypothetical protein
LLPTDNHEHNTKSRRSITVSSVHTPHNLLSPPSSEQLNIPKSSNNLINNLRECSRKSRKKPNLGTSPTDRRQMTDVYSCRAVLSERHGRSTAWARSHCINQMGTTVSKSAATRHVRGRAGQVRAGQGREGQGRAGQGRGMVVCISL